MSGGGDNSPTKGTRAWLRRAARTRTLGSLCKCPGLSLEMDDRKRALESAAPQPAAKRRINPIPAAPTTNGALAASEPALARASLESRVASNAAETGGGKQSGTATADPPRAGRGESDRSEDEDEDEESRQARLRAMSEEEVEELIWGEEGLLAARDEADHCAAMLEGGASDRLPGEVRQRTYTPSFLCASAEPSPCPAASRAGGLARQGASGAPGGGGRVHAGAARHGAHRR